MSSTFYYPRFLPLIPFFLPKVAKEDKEVCCCDHNEPSAYLDHSRNAHPFSLSRLAWAIQQGVDAKCIARYLEGSNTAIVAPILRKDAVHDAFSTYPILFFAAEANSPDLLRTLYRAGADLDSRVLPSMLPLLAYTVLSAEYPLSDTTDTVISLLALGAKPTDIPQDLWVNPLQAPPIVESAVIASNPDYLWCASKVRKAMCANLNLMQRYALRKASFLQPPEPRMLQVAEAHELLPLFETPYHIIGQQLATHQVSESIISHFLFDTETPLVLLLTGPSGHGKTELAKQMGELLNLRLHRVDCAEMRYETDMFGPKAPYANYQIGSPLNNHLAEFADKKSVVFLDEFDKTTADVRKALLLLFESGFYKDRRNNKKIDCTKVIWILAANLGEDMINKFAMKNISDHDTIPKKLMELIQLQLQNEIIQALGAPLAGRISAFIPYLPFNMLEQAVATYKFMRELRNKVRKPINIAAKNFGRHMVLDFIDDGQIALQIAKTGYIPELGARSLKNAVDREIGQKLARAFLSNGGKLSDEMNDGPLEKYQVRVVAGDSATVEVRRAGSKEIQLRKDTFATEGLLEALSSKSVSPISGPLEPPFTFSGKP